MATITIEPRGEGVRLRIAGDLGVNEATPPLLDFLWGPIRDRRTPIVIELSGLKSWEANDWGAIAWAYEQVRRYHGHVILVGPSKAIRRTLEMERLDSVLWIVDREEDVPSGEALDEAWAKRPRPVAAAPATVPPDEVARARMAEMPESFRERYTLERRLGSGGFGEVFVARQTGLGRNVAVKLIPLETLEGSSDLERVAREGLALAALADRNVLSVYEAGVAGRYYCLVTELAIENLRQHLERAWRYFPVSHTYPGFRRLAVEIAGGLAAAHARDILHRDVKPENVLVFRERGQNAFKLGDFGLACRDLYPGAEGAPAPRAGDLLNTWSHGLRGTPLYLAPELWRGASHSRLSDVFALGVVLYEVFGGRHPFPGKTPSELQIAISRHEPDPLHAVHRELPRDLGALVARMLAKEPRARPFCEDVRSALEALPAAS